MISVEPAESRLSARCGRLFKRTWRAAVWLFESVVGAFCLIALLTLAATIPVLNLAALGYLMEVQGRVARTGRIRDALPSLPAARRIAATLAGIALWIAALSWLAGAASDAWLISPGSISSSLWIAGLCAASVIVAAHLLLAICRGGGFWCFLRPLKNARWLMSQLRDGGYNVRVATSLRDFCNSVQLPRYFMLGAFAYAGALFWLAIPTAMFTFWSDSTESWLRLVTFIGALCLAPVLMWLPLLATRCAAEGRFRAFFEVAAIRELFGRSPFRITLASTALYGLSIVPIYYLAHVKTALPPHEGAWDLMLIFLVAIFPAKVLLGWAYHRAARGRRAASPWLWVNRLILAAVVGLYVFVLFLVQTSAQLGVKPVWQHHAQLLPLPT